MNRPACDQAKSLTRTCKQTPKTRILLKKPNSPSASQETSACLGNRRFISISTGARKVHGSAPRESGLMNLKFYDDVHSFCSHLQASIYVYFPCLVTGFGKT
jgi:hypothetical protein